jgi:hypothetical protein
MSAYETKLWGGKPGEDQLQQGRINYKVHRTLTESEALGTVDLARKCLGLAGKIAARGRGLPTRSEVFFERTGSEDRVFEPVAAYRIGGLKALFEELTWIGQRIERPMSSF